MHAESCRVRRMVSRCVIPHSTTRFLYLPKELSLSNRGFRLMRNILPGPSATEQNSIGIGGNDFKDNPYVVKAKSCTPTRSFPISASNVEYDAGDKGRAKWSTEGVPHHAKTSQLGALVAMASTRFEKASIGDSEADVEQSDKRVCPVFNASRLSPRCP